MAITTRSIENASENPVLPGAGACDDVMGRPRIRTSTQKLPHSGTSATLHQKKGVTLGDQSKTRFHPDARPGGPRHPRFGRDQKRV